jgi:hypothetical protein
VLGRTGALVAIATFYLVAFQWPNNLVPVALILAVALAGLLPLALAMGTVQVRGRGGAVEVFALDRLAAFQAMVASGRTNRHFREET